MPPLGDMAGSQAAMRKLAELSGGAGELPPEAAAMEAPPEEMAAGGDPMMLLDELAAACEGLPEGIANEARMHLNALRELLTQGAAASEPAPAEEEAPAAGAPEELPKEMEA